MVVETWSCGQKDNHFSGIKVNKKGILSVWNAPTEERPQACCQNSHLSERAWKPCAGMIMTLWQEAKMPKRNTCPLWCCLLALPGQPHRSSSPLASISQRHGISEGDRGAGLRASARIGRAGLDPGSLAPHCTCSQPLSTGSPVVLPPEFQSVLTVRK